MAAPSGYSGTPLPEKLGIKPGHRVVVLNAPSGYPAALGELPRGAQLTGAIAEDTASVDVIVVFTRSRLAIVDQLPRLRSRIAQNGAIWVAWPKRASKVPTDVTEDVVRDLGKSCQLIDNKVCAIDEVWSGLRLVIPRTLRTR